MAVVCGSRQSAVTRLLARPGGALVRILAGARNFSLPRNIRTDFLDLPVLPFRGDRLLYPLAYSGRGVRLASYFVRILRTRGSAILACVGTVFFNKEVYCTESTYDV